MKALLFHKFKNICIKGILWTRNTNCFTIFVRRNFRRKGHSKLRVSYSPTAMYSKWGLMSSVSKTIFFKGFAGWKVSLCTRICVGHSLFFLFIYLWISISLKGQCHEIFNLNFFLHKSNPSGPQINRLKWFFLKIRFRKDIRI